MRECSWPGTNELMKKYHDKEWGVPSHDDTYLFELLILEGAQAGLSWSIVLNKREEYKKAFHNFDIYYCATLTEEQLEEIKENYLVVKSAAKLRSVRSNALAFLNIQSEFGSFSNYLWNYVEDKPIVNLFDAEEEVPTQIPLSIQISKDLKKRGFKFVGPVIIYSYLQAVGVVDDHIKTCPCHTKNRK